MLEADIQSLQDRIKTLTDENEGLKAALKSVSGRVALSKEDEALVNAKVFAGLSRPDAIEVVMAQKAHDAKLAKETKAPAGK